MSGPRLLYPHFDEQDAEHMVELSEGGPWIHKESSARAHEEAGVPSEEIEPLEYMILRRDKAQLRQGGRY